MFFAIGPTTTLTLEIFDAFMGFQMFAKVAQLTEGSLTVDQGTLMRLLLGMSHQMTVKLGDSMNDFVTFLS